MSPSQQVGRGVIAVFQVPSCRKGCRMRLKAEWRCGTTAMQQWSGRVVAAGQKMSMSMSWKGEVMHFFRRSMHALGLQTERPDDEAVPCIQSNGPGRPIFDSCFMGNDGRACHSLIHSLMHSLFKPATLLYCTTHHHYVADCPQHRLSLLLTYRYARHTSDPSSALHSTAQAFRRSTV